MSRFLHRLGRTCARRSRTVIAVWLLLLTVVAGTAATASKGTSDSFSIPGTESFEALDRLGEAFPGAEGAAGQVVLAAADRPLDDPALRPLVEQTVVALAQVPQVASAADPYEAGTVSPDARVAYSDVQFAVPAGEIEQASRDAVEAAVEPLRAAGVQVELGGEALVQPTSPAIIGEVLGLLVAAVVLVLTLGTLVAAGLPLLTALIGVGIGIAGVTAATAVVDLNSTAPVLALMLGLAVGIDYALFVLARHRQQLAEGMDREDSIALATATAGGAVVFAGSTVVIALAGLAVVGIPFLTQMGLAAAATVTLAVLIAVTLLPALLSALGHRLDAGRVRPSAVAPDPAPSRWAQAVVRRPVVTLVAGTLALLVMALPVLRLELGLPGSEAKSTTSSDRRAYDLVSDAFGPGANGPLLVLVESDADSAEVAADFTRTAAGLPGVAAVGQPQSSEDGRLSLLPVVPASAPTDPRTDDLVGALRDAGAGLAGAQVSVTGATAVNIDTSGKLGSALPVYLLLVVGLALLLLLVVFRSLLVPLTALLGFLLTLAAVGGAVVLVFQEGVGAGLLGVQTEGPIISFLPVLLVGIVFGLAMDYQVFLVTRMRERFLHGASARDAVVLGFTDSARVVTAAALIMIAVFCGFVLDPDPVITSIGFALALGVAVDAFVVRMTLVPAVMALMGDRAWALPRWLDRVVPRVDLEGTAIAGAAAAPGDAHTSTDPDEDAPTAPSPARVG